MTRGLGLIVLLAACGPGEGYSNPRPTNGSGGAVSAVASAGSDAGVQAPLGSAGSSGALAVSDGNAGSSQGGSGGAIDQPEPGSGGVVATGGASTGGTDGTGGVQEPIWQPMPIPSRLQDYSCWLDGGDWNTCKPVPNIQPPIIEWSCGDLDCDSSKQSGVNCPTVAKLRIPPGTCLRLGGYWAPYSDAECRLDSSAGCMYNLPASATVIISNTGTDDIHRYVHRRMGCLLGWTAVWRPLKDC